MLIDLTKGNSFNPIVCNPQVLAIKGVIEIIKRFIDSGQNTTASQAKAAEDIIKAGRQNGVDEMEIKLNNANGLKFKAPFEGCDIETVLGNDNTMTLKVKYK